MGRIHGVGRTHPVGVKNASSRVYSSNIVCLMYTNRMCTAIGFLVSGHHDVFFKRQTKVT